MNDLVARVRGLHALWQRGVADLDVPKANHVERPGILPIAFTLVHFVRGQDATAMDLLDVKDLLWDEHAAKIAHEGIIPARGSAIADAERVRIGDMDAWRAYQTAVFARTEAALAQMTDERYGLPMFDGTRPASLAGGFLEAYVPAGPITRRQAIEAWIYQHGSRHLGELEHARSLVGLGGLS